MRGEYFDSIFSFEFSWLKNQQTRKISAKTLRRQYIVAIALFWRLKHEKKRKDINTPVTVAIAPFLASWHLCAKTKLIVMLNSHYYEAFTTEI
ncbi:MAG: hypothetical protein ABIO46_12255 [Chitinophagales bacterium]